jgi:hypothetical protein
MGIPWMEISRNDHIELWVTSAKNVCAYVMVVTIFRYSLEQDHSMTFSSLAS